MMLFPRGSRGVSLLPRWALSPDFRLSFSESAGVEQVLEWVFIIDLYKSRLHLGNRT